MKTTRWRCMILFGIAATLPKELAFADYATGLDEYQRGNFASAVHEWRMTAEHAIGLIVLPLQTGHQKTVANLKSCQTYNASNDLHLECY